MLKRILIVESNALFRDALAHVLTWHEGADTSHGARSVEEGLRYAREGRLEGIHLAVVEPLADGSALSLIEALRCAEPGVPILALTLAQDSWSHGRMLEAGANEVLTKDASVEDILATVRRLAD